MLILGMAVCGLIIELAGRLDLMKVSSLIFGLAGGLILMKAPSLVLGLAVCGTYEGSKPDTQDGSVWYLCRQQA